MGEGFIELFQKVGFNFKIASLEAIASMKSTMAKIEMDDTLCQQPVTATIPSSNKELTASYRSYREELEKQAKTRIKENTRIDATAQGLSNTILLAKVQIAVALEDYTSALAQIFNTGKEELEKYKQTLTENLTKPTVLKNEIDKSLSKVKETLEIPEHANKASKALTAIHHLLEPIQDSTEQKLMMQEVWANFKSHYTESRSQKSVFHKDIDENTSLATLINTMQMMAESIQAHNKTAAEALFYDRVNSKERVEFLCELMAKHEDVEEKFSDNVNLNSLELLSRQPSCEKLQSALQTNNHYQKKYNLIFTRAKNAKYLVEYIEARKSKETGEIMSIPQLSEKIKVASAEDPVLAAAFTSLFEDSQQTIEQINHRLLNRNGSTWVALEERSLINALKEFYSETVKEDLQQIIQSQFKLFNKPKLVHMREMFGLASAGLGILQGLAIGLTPLGVVVSALLAFIFGVGVNRAGYYLLNLLNPNSTKMDTRLEFGGFKGLYHRAKKIFEINTYQDRITNEQRGYIEEFLEHKKAQFSYSFTLYLSDALKMAVTEMKRRSKEHVFRQAVNELLKVATNPNMEICSNPQVNVKSVSPQVLLQKMANLNPRQSRQSANENMTPAQSYEFLRKVIESEYQFAIPGTEDMTDLPEHSAMPELTPEVLVKLSEWRRKVQQEHWTKELVKSYPHNQTTEGSSSIALPEASSQSGETALDITSAVTDEALANLAAIAYSTNANEAQLASNTSEQRINILMNVFAELNHLIINTANGNQIYREVSQRFCDEIGLGVEFQHFLKILEEDSLQCKHSVLSYFLRAVVSYQHPARKDECRQCNVYIVDIAEKVKALLGEKEQSADPVNDLLPELTHGDLKTLCQNDQRSKVLDEIKENIVFALTKRMNNASSRSGSSSGDTSPISETKKHESSSGRTTPCHIETPFGELVKEQFNRDNSIQLTEREYENLKEGVISGLRATMEKEPEKSSFLAYGFGSLTQRASSSAAQLINDASIEQIVDEINKSELPGLQRLSAI